jgi:hypothetical protein
MPSSFLAAIQPAPHDRGHPKRLILVHEDHVCRILLEQLYELEVAPGPVQGTLPAAGRRRQVAVAARVARRDSASDPEPVSRFVRSFCREAPIAGAPRRARTASTGEHVMMSASRSIQQSTTAGPPCLAEWRRLYHMPAAQESAVGPTPLSSWGWRTERRVAFSLLGSLLEARRDLVGTAGRLERAWPNRPRVGPANRAGDLCAAVPAAVRSNAR